MILSLIENFVASKDLNVDQYPAASYFIKIKQ